MCMAAIAVLHRRTDVKAFLVLLVAGRERRCAKLFRGLAVISELFASRSPSERACAGSVANIRYGEQRRRNRERATRKKGEPTESSLTLSLLSSSNHRYGVKMPQMKWNRSNIHRYLSSAGLVPLSPVPSRQSLCSRRS